ncbi:Fe-S cluster assembly protein SufD [Acidocella sp. KAb 2-4]|uniref:Fe-S cluster assembly protein SufD n=1 Tax=Acidocella sp. KAb 2-4 TaxID=2885158 RepID=UPI001D0826B7|nr:Fe-S cluster assembly protein SufD [Acidocella sp. KAb 2-4]MCB5945368.1 Fe-S cluster assembly protein SufD [Acidocella sp. KAb 2-4]
MTALPTKKLEAWRYTDLRPLSGISFVAPPVGAAPALPDLGLPRLVFLNGVFNAALSSPFAFARGFAPVAEDSALPLAQINAEQAHDGATLHVPAGVDAGTVLLISHATGDVPFAFHLRHRITLGEGARLTVLEIAKGEGIYWHNPVTDITLAANAALTHIRVQEESRAAYSLATIRASVAASASYEHFTATIGGQLSRTEIHAALTGPGALAHLNAAQLLNGTQHGDFTTVVAHKAPGCASRQTVKSVLADTARGVFQGRIEVARGAQQTDGFQLSQALLLSPGAEMDTKPELEIFADDVKCSHGATVGALDEEQLFYLRSRGIPEAQARAMLIRAFLEAALEPVTQKEARTLLEAAINNWWVQP